MLFPRVAVDVVAVALPEPGLLGVAQLEAAYPLGALPEVEVWDEQASGATVLGGERRTLVLVGQPRLAAGDVLERQVRRVPAVAEGEYVAGCGLDAVEQRVDRDPTPGSVELRPLGHAMDVDRRGHAGQL